MFLIGTCNLCLQKHGGTSCTRQSAQRLNLNKLASMVALSEGKKKETDIAQIKEVMRHLFRILSAESDDVILKTVRK